MGSLDKEVKLPGMKKKVKPKEVAVFSRQLATMVNSGLTLVRALTVLQEQTRNPTFAQIISDVRTRVEQGSSLSASLANHPRTFGTLYVAMIQAGEVGGALDETLVRLADTLESGVRLRSKVKSAMAYPVMVFGLVILITSAMLLFIVPIFSRMSVAGRPRWVRKPSSRVSCILTVPPALGFLAKLVRPLHHYFLLMARWLRDR